MRTGTIQNRLNKLNLQLQKTEERQFAKSTANNQSNELYIRPSLIRNQFQIPPNKLDSIKITISFPKGGESGVPSPAPWTGTAAGLVSRGGDGASSWSSEYSGSSTTGRGLNCGGAWGAEERNEPWRRPT